MLDERDLKLNGMPAVLRALTTLEQHFVALEARVNEHVREAHLHTNELPAGPGLPLGEKPAVKLAARAPWHHRWQDNEGVWHDDMIGFGMPIGRVILQDVDGIARSVPLFNAGPDTPMLNAKAAYEAQLASLTGPALSPEARAKQRADLVEAATTPAHTVEEDFQHFLTVTYAGWAGKLSAQTIAYMRAAYQTGAQMAKPDHLVAVEMLLKVRNAELNTLHAWLQTHGFAPTSLVAECTIQVLNSLLRDSNTAELDLLRKIVDRLEKVVQEKATGGLCMHDILSHKQFQSIYGMIKALRRVQAGKPTTAQGPNPAQAVPPVVDPLMIANLKLTYDNLPHASYAWDKGLKAFLMEHGVPYEQAQQAAGDF